MPTEDLINIQYGSCFAVLEATIYPAKVFGCIFNFYQGGVQRFDSNGSYEFSNALSSYPGCSKIKIYFLLFPHEGCANPHTYPSENYESQLG